MKTLILLTLVCSLVPAASQQFEATQYEQFEYRGRGDLSRVAIAVPIHGDDGFVISGFDAFNEALFCPAGDDFVCVFSGIYAFAFPRASGPPPDSWEVAGVKFELIRSDVQVSLLGQTVEGLYEVRTPPQATIGGMQGNRATFTLYSPNRGVIAFGLETTVDGPPAMVFWSVSDRGFGATHASGQK